jgi:hypothetical protein
MIVTFTNRRLWLGTTAMLAAALAPTQAAAKNWSDWAAPASIEALPDSSTLINTPGVDGCASLSHDGLELYFTSARPGGLGGPDIWVARRSSTSVGFGAPENLGAPVNSSSIEFCPTIMPGGRLFFSSGRSDPAGDLYVARRGPHGWSQPENLGPNINSSGAVEESAALYEDGQGREVLHFSSGRSGRNQIYYSVDYAPAALAPGGVNSSAADARPSISKDGLEIFWDSTRSGSLGGPDFWTATRSSTSEPWGTAVHLVDLSSGGPGGMFQPGFDARAFLSWDRSMLILGSARDGAEGLNDILFTTREKVTGND